MRTAIFILAVMVLTAVAVILALCGGLDDIP